MRPGSKKMVKREFIVKDLTDKIPPQNLEAETAVLGSLLIDKDAITKVADILNAEDFYKTANGIIYTAMRSLYEKRSPVDLLTLSNKLEESGELENLGGISYLTELASTVATSANVIDYAKIIQVKAVLRRMISAAGEIATLGYQQDTDVDELLDRAEQSLFQVSKKHLAENFIPVKKVLEENFDRLDALSKSKKSIRGVPTGFTDLDKTLSGLNASDLIILAARPSMGKTSLALNIAHNVAVNEGIPVGFFALEMSKEQLVDRLLSMEASLPAYKLRSGELTDDDFAKIGTAMARLSEAPLFIDDSAISTALEMRTKARRLQAEHGLGLVVIDYLQLMDSTIRNENRVQQISEISRSLKALARELDVPVLALSQLNRAVEARPNKEPELSDLRESGSIEQDADIVMFIYRDEVYNRDTEKKNIADIFIKKHRSGPTRNLELLFQPEYMRFKNLENRKQV